MLRLERDAWSTVKLLRQATNEYPLVHLPKTDFRGMKKVQQKISWPRLLFWKKNTPTKKRDSDEVLGYTQLY